MSKIEKLIKKIFMGSSVSYKDAERLLFHLGFDLDISGSHHIFRKRKYNNIISIKKRSELQQYQIRDLKKILVDHDYEK